MVSTPYMGLWKFETLKTGEIKIDWQVKKLSKALHQILHETPGRCAVYTGVTANQQLPLPFCGTRWIENEEVPVRAIDIWENMSVMQQLVSVTAKSKQPSVKSYMCVLLPCYLLPKILSFWQNCTSSPTSLVPWNLWQSANPQGPWCHFCMTTFISC